VLEYFVEGKKDMAMRQITVRLPQETIRQFDRLVSRQGQARDAVLAQLIREHIQRATRARKIGQMTLAILGIKTARTRRARTFDARRVARALEQTYGTRDGVKIVNLHRDGGMACR
jgi:metal-responsive CopG/Arc/MetJ family transcriptional regulator